MSGFQLEQYIVALTAVAMCIAILLVSAVLVRSRQLRGSLAIKSITKTFLEIARALPAATYSTFARWLPVPLLLCIGIGALQSGLSEVAVCTLVAAAIAQLYRYDFPVVWAAALAVGWSTQDVITHRSLILPISRRVIVALAFILATYALCLSEMLARYGLLLTATMAIFASLDAVIRDALKLERAE